MSNHTVSWHYTLSTRVTSLTESSPGGKVHSQDKSRLTLVHVPREAGQDTTQRCCIKKVHRAMEDPAEQLVVEHGGSLHRALSTQTTCCAWTRDLTRVNNNFRKHMDTFIAWINRQLEWNCLLVDTVLNLKSHEGWTHMLPECYKCYICYACAQWWVAVMHRVVLSNVHL